MRSYLLLRRGVGWAGFDEVISSVMKGSGLSWV